MNDHAFAIDTRLRPLTAIAACGGCWLIPKTQARYS